jgi:hypothetical protein
MPGPSEHAIEHLVIEVLAPIRRKPSSSIVCDCCRIPREAGDFDQDGCGICVICLECDDVLVELETELMGCGI